MTTLRRRIAWIACAWMACQLSLLTAAPVSLLAHMPQAADAITCTCVHGGAGECPMHHPAKKKSGCECRNTTDPDAASLVSLLGPIAVLNAPANLEPPAITKLPDYPITRFVSVAAPLASPPPRA